jgi:hemolysin III
MKLEKRFSIPVEMPVYSLKEEILSCTFHGIGFLGAIGGFVLLLLKISGSFGGQAGDRLGFIAVIVYSVTMICLFLFSTLYHLAREKNAKQILRKFDHLFVFIFIAGAYTPYCLIGLKGAWGWTLFALEWAMAATGVTLDLLGSKTLKKIQVAIFLIMGWAIFAGFFPLVRSIPLISIILLAVGGGVYTLGTAWYRKKHIQYTHAIWHGFVVAGAVCHWFSIWFLI